MNKNKHLVVLNSTSNNYPIDNTPLDISEFDTISIQVDSMPISSEVLMHIITPNKVGKVQNLSHTQVLVMDREVDEIGLFFIGNNIPENREVKFSVSLSSHPKKLG